MLLLTNPLFKTLNQFELTTMVDAMHEAPLSYDDGSVRCLFVLSIFNAPETITRRFCPQQGADRFFAQELFSSVPTLLKKFCVTQGLTIYAAIAMPRKSRNQQSEFETLSGRAWLRWLRPRPIGCIRSISARPLSSLLSRTLPRSHKFLSIGQARAIGKVYLGDICAGKATQDRERRSPICTVIACGSTCRSLIFWRSTIWRPSPGGSSRSDVEGWWSSRNLEGWP